MHKSTIHDFLEGKANLPKEQPNTNEDDFIEVYQKLLNETDAKIDFDPFAKVKAEKEKRTIKLVKLIPYAAAIVLVFLSIMIFNPERQQPQKVLNTTELQQLNTETQKILMQFSNDFKRSFSEIKRHSNENMNTRNNPANIFSIQISNPIKNIKTNTL